MSSASSSSYSSPSALQQVIARHSAEVIFPVFDFLCIEELVRFLRCNHQTYVLHVNYLLCRHHRVNYSSLISVLQKYDTKAFVDRDSGAAENNPLSHYQSNSRWGSFRFNNFLLYHWKEFHSLTFLTHFHSISHLELVVSSSYIFSEDEIQNSPNCESWLPRSLRSLSVHLPVCDNEAHSEFQAFLAGMQFINSILQSSVGHNLQELYLSCAHVLNSEILKQMTCLRVLSIASRKTDRADTIASPIRPGCLPASLQSLTLGELYYPFPFTDGVLPAGLLSLQLPAFYDCPIHAGVLPSSLTVLCVGRRFTHPIGIGVLPNAVKVLRLSNFIDDLQPGVLPSELRDLEVLSEKTAWLVAGVLPPKLESLKCVLSSPTRFAFTKDVLPQTLTSLAVSVLAKHGRATGGKMKLIEALGFHCLPAALLSVKLLDNFNQSLSTGDIPCGLHSLVLGNDFNENICSGALPSSLRTLHIGLDRNARYCKQLKPNILNDGLIELRIAGQLQSAFAAGVLPSTLRKLDLSDCSFNASFADNKGSTVLPLGLRTLLLGTSFNSAFGPIPPSLSELVFPQCSAKFCQQLPPLPATLISLAMSDTYAYPLCALPSGLRFLRTSRESIEEWIKKGDLAVVPVELVEMTVSWRSAPLSEEEQLNLVVADDKFFESLSKRDVVVRYSRAPTF